jgi:hypothetical protein
MMRNNGLLKWTLHKNKNGSNGKTWQHPPDALTNGHIAYLVKFLGVTEAEHPKGIDVVKDCIRKLKLDEEIRRAEGGKTPKAEVTISVDGVAVQEPKGKKILHQFPLHQISYCADDKAEKKFFSFIAKDGEVHKCFVFASEKLAEEITLTIGQAFDLAYRRFLDSSGREMELKREIMVLQKRIAELENENTDLKVKLNVSPSSSMSSSSDMNSNSSTASSSSLQDTADLLICPPVPPRGSVNVANQLIAEFAMTANEIEKRAQENRQLDGLLFDVEEELDSNCKPRGSPDGIEAPPRISPPPKGKKTENVNGTAGTDIFGSDPFFTSPDPFGMPDFSSTNNFAQNQSANILQNNINSTALFNGGSGANNGFTNGATTPTMNGHGNNHANYNINLSSFSGPNNNFTLTSQNNATNNNNNMKPQAIDNALQILDKKIEEMKLGFSRGIHNDDFPLESLDPLRQS